jgi:hypothetical protein
LLDIVRGAGSATRVPDSAGLIFIFYFSMLNHVTAECCRAWLTGR